MTIERRFTKNKLSTIECRAAGDGEKVISGYGAVFYDGSAQTEYELFDGYFERIDKDAFSEIVGSNDVMGLFNHDSNFVLGRTPNTMRLSVDSRGLKYDIDIPKTNLGNDLHISIERGDITGSSFSFRPEKIEWSEEIREGRKVEVRTIKKVGYLKDVGPVTFPAYEATEAQARSSEEAIQERQKSINEKFEADKKARERQIRLSELG